METYVPRWAVQPAMMPEGLGRVGRGELEAHWECQPRPSASSFFSQLQSPSWPAAMHPPAPAELFNSGAVPGSTTTFLSSPAMSAYQQRPASFSEHSFIPSLSVKEMSASNPSFYGALSPYDPLLPLRTPPQSCVDLNCLVSSHDTTYRGPQDLSPLHTPLLTTSSGHHSSFSEFNLLSSPDQLSQFYDAAVFSSTPTPPPSLPLERAILREDSVIKHYQRSPQHHSSQLLLQQHVSSAGTFKCQSMPGQHQQPAEGQNSSSDLEPSNATDSRTFPLSRTLHPLFTFAGSSSAPCNSSPSSSSAPSSSQTLHTPPSASSTSFPSPNSNGNSGSLSRQHLPSQASLNQPSPSPTVSSVPSQHTSKLCLSTHGSPPEAPVKPGPGVPRQTPPQQRRESYSPGGTLRCFDSPRGEGLSAGTGNSEEILFPNFGSGGQTFCADQVSGSLSSLKRTGSPSLGCGGATDSNGPVGPGGAAHVSLGAESSLKPSRSSATFPPVLNSPAPVHPAHSPAGSEVHDFVSVSSPAFMSSPQDAPSFQSQYHARPAKSKSEDNTLAVEQSEDEAQGDEDFLLRPVLCHQSPNPRLSPRHPESSPQQVHQTSDEERKRLIAAMEEVTEGEYNSKSVICTNFNFSSSTNGVVTSSGTTTHKLNDQQEMSPQRQQDGETDFAQSESTTKSTGKRGDSKSHSHTTNTLQQYHDSHNSVAIYGRGDLNSQVQHSHQTSFPYSEQIYLQHGRSQCHSCVHPHVERPKCSDVSYFGKAQLSQVPKSLKDSLRDPQHQDQAHAQHRVPSHTSHTAPLVTSHSHNQSSQLQPQPQMEGMDTHHHLAPQTEDKKHTGQNVASTVDLLDRSLDNSRDSTAAEPTGVAAGMSVERDETGTGDRRRQQRSLTSHTNSDFHTFVSQPHVPSSTSSHMSPFNPLPSRSRVDNQLQSHPRPHFSHPQMVNAHFNHVTADIGALAEQPQTQPAEPESQLFHASFQLLKHPQFDTYDSLSKAGQNQRAHRYVPVPPTCSSDSLSQMEDHLVFPGMEEMFCSDDFRSSCDGDFDTGHVAQGGVPQGYRQGEECLESLKTKGSGGCSEAVRHYSGYGPASYCHGPEEKGNGSMHLNLDSPKTQESPLAINAEQLDLIQSQTPTTEVGSGLSGYGSVCKTMEGNSYATVLTSPPSYHVLKQPHDPPPHIKKNYAEEYEFQDDEDKAGAAAHIRLNSRHLPDLLSNCRKTEVAPGASGWSPLDDTDFCQPLLGPPAQLLQHHIGPKKRGRKPTKPKRDGPPRPRGRPRIRPLPEPAQCKGVMGSAGGESRRGRGRGRGRGRKETFAMDMSSNRGQSVSWNQQHQQQHFSGQHHPHQHPQQDPRVLPPNTHHLQRPYQLLHQHRQERVAGPGFGPQHQPLHQQQ